VAASIGED